MTFDDVYELAESCARAGWRSIPLTESEARELIKLVRQGGGTVIGLDDEGLPTWVLGMPVVIT